MWLLKTDLAVLEDLYDSFVELYITFSPGKEVWIGMHYSLVLDKRVIALFTLFTRWLEVVFSIPHFS